MMKDKEPLRMGVIDIGTHSVKLFIAEESEGDIKILESLKNVVALGRDTFFKERISQESINRTVAILEKYNGILKEYAITNPRVIATTAVREARNMDVFIDTILRRTGLNIEVLTAGDVVYYIDAYLSHKLKGRYPIHEKNLLIAEPGAGSFDISLLAQGFTLMNVGLPLGTLRLKQLMSKLDGSIQENYEALRENIENEFAYLKRSMPPLKVDDIILIDESYSQYLGNILTDKKFEDTFFQLSHSDTQQLLEKLRDKKPEDMTQDYKVPVETAETFIEYATILDSFVGLSENKNIYILETSLSEAILANEILDYETSQKYNKANQLISIANALCRKYNVDLNHAHHVSKLADTLFDSFKDLLGLKKTESLYLILAAYLHDIGMFIYNRTHHKHSEYIINTINFFRLSNDEIKTIACIARYHRKGSPSDAHLLYQSLPANRQILVQKLSALLRIANSLDRSHKQKIKALEIKFNKAQDITFLVTTDANFTLERCDFLEKKEALEDISGNKISLKIKPV